MAEEKKKKKVGRIIVDCILGGLIVLVLGMQVNTMLTKKDNYDVPSLFGYSFMQVLTDSMEGSAPDAFDAGEGIIIQKKDVNEVKPEDVITFFSESIHFCVSHRVQEIVYSPKTATEPGSFIVSASQEYSFNRTDWVKGGELVSLASGESFYTRATAKEAGKEEPYVSHQIPKYTEEQKIMFYTCGDNLEADWYVESTGHSVASNYRDNVDSKYYVGTVISHNKFLGGVLGTVQAPWFIPAVIMLPILLIAALSVVDFIKGWKEETKREEAEFQAALEAAGIDKTDERAVLIFKEKYQYKLDMQRELEAIKKEQKEIYLKELKKAQEELKKDKEFERIKEEEKRRILEEMKKEEEEKKQ